MGGEGSGHRHDSKPTVEDCLALDVKSLSRIGAFCWQLDADKTRSLAWTSSRTGEEVGSIGYRVQPLDVTWAGSAPPSGRGFRPILEKAVLWLSYRWRDSEDLDYPVSIESTRPHFGGLRYWLRCPILIDGKMPCWRRVGKLHLPHGVQRFGCRYCHGLTYESSKTAHQIERLVFGPDRCYRD
jgi:hypothetical protein